MSSCPAQRAKPAVRVPAPLHRPRHSGRRMSSTGNPPRKRSPRMLRTMPGPYCHNESTRGCTTEVKLPSIVRATNRLDCFFRRAVLFLIVMCATTPCTLNRAVVYVERHFYSIRCRPQRKAATNHRPPHPRGLHGRCRCCAAVAVPIIRRAAPVALGTSRS
jgi:hypothetical protein